MANNKKRKAQQKKRKAPEGGGPKKPPQQAGSNPPASGANTAPAAASGPQRPPSNKPQKQAKQAKAAGERRMSSAERRAAARRAQKRKRQITTVVIPVVIILVLIVGLIIINGGVEGGGKTAAPGDVKTDAQPRKDNLAVGDKAPVFSAPELTSGTVNLADYEGKPLVIPVWAAWCPNCQKELPVIEKLSKEFPDVPVVSIVTSQGQEPGPTPEKYVADNGITFPVAVDDNSGKLRGAYGVTGFPTVYFVGADGKVANVTVGLREETELRDAFAQIQTGTPAASPSPKKNQ
jgi:cytochrome c biogenesis protein CcmG, thiol:disulfide interchange protein DsbE